MSAPLVSVTESAAVAVDPEEDVYIRLTPKGERHAEQLSRMTPEQQERAMVQIIRRVRREQRAKVLAALRAAGDEGLPIQQLCKLLDTTLARTLETVAEIENEDRVVYIEFDTDDDNTGVPWARISEGGAR